ncbi:MAG: phage tail tape measure protein, partial [Pantoea sp.]|nr:phage tail tape measure protein [Pantoea sp.]
MSLPEADDSRGKTVEALQEQGRLISEQEGKVSSLKRRLEELNSTRGGPGLTSENDNNIVKAAGILTSQLAVEEEKLNQLRGRSQTIQETLTEIERRRNDLIKEQAWRQNVAYQSLLHMNGQHTEFNRLLSLGNQLLASRQGLQNIPFRIPSAELTDKQSDALSKAKRESNLSSLTGVDRVRREAELSADDLGFTNTPQYVQYRQQYIRDTVEAWQKREAANKAVKDGQRAESEAAKEQRSAAQVAEQYSRKIADLSVATEVQRVRASQGEKAAELYAASHENGTKWSEEQRKSIEAGAVALAQWTQKANEAVHKQREMADALKDLKDAARKYQ